MRECSSSHLYTKARSFQRGYVYPYLHCEDVLIDTHLHRQTTIGVSPYLLNNHPSVFPDPHAFRPERWLEARECGVNLNRHLASFSKGGRMCAGIK